MSARHGDIGVGAQLDAAADLPGEGFEPARPILKHGNDGWMRDQPFRAGCVEGGPAQQCPCLEGDAVLRQLDQRGAEARPDDLDEAEAIDGRPFKRLRQRSIDRRRRALPRRLRSAGTAAPDRP